MLYFFRIIVFKLSTGKVMDMAQYRQFCLKFINGTMTSNSVNIERINKLFCKRNGLIKCIIKVQLM